MGLVKYEDFYDGWGKKRKKPKDADDWEPDEAEDEDEDGLGDVQECSRLRGLIPAFMASPSTDGLNRPATDPIKWKPYLERGGFMIYDSPTDEFNRNRFQLNRETLLYRWEGMKNEKGLPVEEEIERLFADWAQAIVNRAIAQDEMRGKLSLPNKLDPKSLEIGKNWYIQLVENRIAFIEYKLDEGVEIKVEEYYRVLKGGTLIKEEVRPLSELSRARLDRDLRAYMEIWLKLTGQNVKKVETTHEVGGSIREIMMAQMKANGHVTPTGHTMSELREIARPTNALPPPSEVQEAVVVSENAKEPLY